MTAEQAEQFVLAITRLNDAIDRLEDTIRRAETLQAGW